MVEESLPRLARTHLATGLGLNGSPHGASPCCGSTALVRVPRRATAQVTFLLLTEPWMPIPPRKWLSQRPEIDPDRIILAGWSHGGAAVLAALGSPPPLFGARKGTKPFVAGI